MNSDDFYWHESAGARILIPKGLIVASPFPELCAKATRKLQSVIFLVTNSPNQRDIAERSFQQPPRGTPSVIDVRIICNAPITSPFSGKEMIWEMEVVAHPIPSHAVLQVLELDVAAGVFAVIHVQGEGLYKTSEHIWQAGLNSFSWDRARGVFLKFDGDEFLHRKRYSQKRSRKKRATSPKLPVSLRYLQPVIDELLSLPSEEIHEDLDLSQADRLLQKRVHGLSKVRATEKLGKDRDALRVWIEKDPTMRGNAEFLRGMLEYVVASDLFNRSNADRIE